MELNLRDPASGYKEFHALALLDTEAFVYRQPRTIDVEILRDVDLALWLHNSPRKKSTEPKDLLNEPLWN
jgi:hypothetical protein